MTARIAARLAAAAPGWSEESDVVVVGSGVAGLTAAIEARQSGYRVTLVTKADVGEGSTVWAQGGVAAALGPEDTPEEHWRDTVVAGAGLCDADAVRVLVGEGARAVFRLIRRGAEFDRTDTGDLQLTREGGHHMDRIAHAGGDATGAEISRALIQRIRDDEGIQLIEHALALDVLLDSTGAAQGITLHVMGEGEHGGVGSVLAPAVILATGGIGQVFAQTTNPVVATGDGIAMALRAGAACADLEFVQFHPTVLFLGPDAKGQLPLISEAVRGEGAFLVDDDGARVMAGVHPLADLAPRDVVAKAITKHLHRSGADHVWLDGREIGERWPTRFPSIFHSLEAHGIDPRTQLIPVAPAQHYHSGGILTDLYGRTNVPGLFAAGEAACTGVHGANRLASNSLLEGLVFAERIAAVLDQELPARRPVAARPARAQLVSNDHRPELQALLSKEVGVVRSAESLARATEWLNELVDHVEPAPPRTANWEMTNLQAVAAALTLGALTREESRGSHWREDFDSPSNKWLQRVVITMDVNGVLQTKLRKVPQLPDAKEVL